MPVRRRAALLASLVLSLALALNGSAAARSEERPPPRAATAVSPELEGFRSPRTYDAVALPVRLRIPAARVDTPLERLGRAADETIALPSGPRMAGWYREGPRPGQPGPAVIIGHVDWDRGPAVFFHLSRLRPGDAVYVHRADTSVARFRVTGVSQVSKSRFPTDQVYAPTLEPSLRLVTCGGSFDRATRNYADNVIVFAVPV